MWENRGLVVSRKGMTGIEVIVALGLLGLTAVVFLGGLSTALKASYLADERSVAESLARSEMEYVKSQPYSTDPWSYTVTTSGSSATAGPSWFDPGHALSAECAGYSVQVSAEDFDADGDGVLDVHAQQRQGGYQDDPSAHSAHRADEAGGDRYGEEYAEWHHRVRNPQLSRVIRVLLPPRLLS